MNFHERYGRPNHAALKNNAFSTLMQTKQFGVSHIVYNAQLASTRRRKTINFSYGSFRFKTETCLNSQSETLQDLYDFWSRESGTKWFKEHPVLSASQLRSMCFPSYCPQVTAARILADIATCSILIQVLTQDPNVDWTTCIPIRIYGDGAEAQRNWSAIHVEVMESLSDNIQTLIVVGQ